MAGRRRPLPRLLLPFLPSFAFGTAGAIWVALAPANLSGDASWAQILLTATVLTAILLGIGWVLERRVLSFRHGSRMIELALARLRIPIWLALLLAGTTALGEEMFFRGGVQQVIGVWGQALVFGALHPIDRRAWAYTLFTVLAGALFGYATVLTGSLWAAALAHFVVNLHGLLSVRRIGPRATLR